jgi:hypothetical protein
VLEPGFRNRGHTRRDLAFTAARINSKTDLPKSKRADTRPATAFTAFAGIFDKSQVSNNPVLTMVVVTLNSAEGLFS